MIVGMYQATMNIRFTTLTIERDQHEHGRRLDHRSASRDLQRTENARMHLEICMHCHLWCSDNVHHADGGCRLLEEVDIIYTVLRSPITSL